MVGKVEFVRAPLATHQLERGETEVCGTREAGHEYAGEAYGGESVDGADNLLEIAQRNLELEPFHFLLALTGAHHRHLPVGDVVAAHHEVGRTDGDAILVVALVFVKGIVLVYVLDIGRVARRLVKRVARVFGRKRVAFHSVVAFVALENAEVLLVVIVAAEKVVIVARRVVKRRKAVGLHAIERGRGEFQAQAVEIAGVGFERELVGVGEAVETYVLRGARAGVVIESVCE